MALIIEDRILETSTTATAGNFTLLGAVTGYRAASVVCANSDTFYYYIEGVDSNGIPTGEWESGLGTWTTGNILVRTTVHRSSNANSVVTFSAGTKRVAMALTATLVKSIPLNYIGSAGVAATIAHGNIPIVWNWTQTTASQTGFSIGETTASTGGAGSQVLYKIGTLAASTADPLQVQTRGVDTIRVSRLGAVTIAGLTGVTGGGAAGSGVTITSGIGAAGSGGGPISITTGAGSTSGGAGGTFTITGGDGGATGGAGGSISLVGGIGQVTGAGGNVSLTGGGGGAGGSGVGGNVLITGGAGVGTGAGGLARLWGGQGATNASGGGAQVLGGAGVGAASGGAISITAGAGGVTSGAGGSIDIITGAGSSTTGVSGNLTLKSGTGGSSASSGTVLLSSGNAGTSGNSGNVTIITGTATTGTGGTITIQPADGQVGGTLSLQSGASTTSGNSGGPLYITAGTGGGTAAGGQARFKAGTGGATGSGGIATIIGGTGGVTSGDGGAVNVTGGQAGNAGVGGIVYITGGTGIGAGYNGGAVTIAGGAPGTGTVRGGDVNITAGNGIGGANGSRINLTVGTGATGGKIVITNGPLEYAPTVTIASASTTDIGTAASNSIIVSGVTTITALGTAAAGVERNVTFSGILTLTHNATSLILSPASNITTAAGDVAYFISLGSGNWRCSSYQKAAGSGGGVTVADDTTTNANTYYPTLANNQTSGSASTLTVSSTKLAFNPSTGTLSSVVFNATSDERAKENIRPIGYGLDEILNLVGKKFEMKDSGLTSIGLIAQDVEKIIPEVVSDNIDGMKGINYPVLTAVLIEAVKQLTERVRILESK